MKFFFTKTTQLTKVLLVLALGFGVLTSCGPINQNESAVDDETATVDGDIEEGAGGEAVFEANDSDNDSMIRDATQNENRGTSAESDIASGANAADVNISMTVANDNEAWIVTNVEGAAGLEEMDGGISEEETNLSNPTITLNVGERYRFNNPLYDVHVLQFRDGEGNVLLGQGETGGTFEDDEDVNPVISDNAVTFTLTDALAQEIADYHSEAYRAMTGEIEVFGTQ